MGLYVLTAEAKANLREIRDYIADDNVERAVRILREVRSVMSDLADMPGVGHRRDDLTDAEVRFRNFYNYLIVYRPETRPIEIVAIIHGARDLPSQLEGLS